MGSRMQWLYMDFKCVNICSYDSIIMEHLSFLKSRLRNKVSMAITIHSSVQENWEFTKRCVFMCTNPPHTCTCSVLEGQKRVSDPRTGGKVLKSPSLFARTASWRCSGSACSPQTQGKRLPWCGALSQSFLILDGCQASMLCSQCHELCPL